MPEVTIYLLRDPRTQAIRYVGATRKTLAKRLRDHEFSAYREANVAPRFDWLRELAAANVRPEIEQLAIVDEAERGIAEQYWIDHYREAGCDLLNRKPGGGGPLSTSTRSPWSAEQRARASAVVAAKYRNDPDLRRRVSQGTQAAMAAYLAAHGDAYRAKVSAGLKRRYESQEAHDVTAAAGKRRWETATDEQRENHRRKAREAVAREQRVKCPSCNMVSRPAGIACHRRASGH